MHKPIPYTIRGLAPMIPHNGQLADPLNPYTKRMKEITGKKTKSDDDYARLYDIEWEGGLYLNADRQPILPGENIEAAMVEGGRKLKLGKQCEAGILCDGAWPIKHDGPKDLEGLRADSRFRDVRKAIVNNKNSVMRCRPIFPAWQVSFTLLYLPDLLNEAQVTNILEIVGRIIGICDHTPRYGRFELI